MNKPPPPLICIRSFERAARHLSFTLAARELGYTQAAVSTHVRMLEQYLGRPLFERKTRSLKLTEIGEAFLPTLRQALQQIDNATEAVVASSRDRSVSLACPMSLAENWVPGMVQGFSASCPDVDVVIHGTVWENPGEPIADLSITINRDGDAPPGAVRLWQERLILVCAPALAGRVISAADITTLPKIFVLGRPEYWTGMAAALSLPRIDLEKGHKTNATNIALEMAASGLGLTVALASLTKTYVDRGLLVEPLASRPDSPWSYYMRASSIHHRSAVDRLRDWILNARPYDPWT